jgi:hypothetical protein
MPISIHCNSIQLAVLPIQFNSDIRRWNIGEVRNHTSLYFPSICSIPSIFPLFPLFGRIAGSSIWAKHLKHLSQPLNGPSIWASISSISASIGQHCGVGAGSLARSGSPMCCALLLGRASIYFGRGSTLLDRANHRVQRL